MRRLGERQGRGVRDRQAIPLLESPLGILVELDHVARPVGGGQAAFGLAGIDRDQAGELAVLRPELPGVPQDRADRRRDVPGFGVRRRDHQDRFLVVERLPVIDGDVPVTVLRLGDLQDPAHRVDGVEALQRLALG